MAAFFAHGGDLDWAVARGWNIVPAGIGNMIGAATLVAVPYWYVFMSTPARDGSASSPD